MALEKQILLKVSGSGSSLSQVFVSNTISSPKPVVVTSPLNFEVPVYTLNGATKNFYIQTTDGISASLNNIKTFIFNISANTNSLSGTTKMKHDIYRLDYDVFTKYTPTDVFTTLTTPELLTLFSGFTSTTINSMINPNSENLITKPSIDLISSLIKPIFTLIEDVSGTTFFSNSSHTLTLPQKIKPTGQYTQDLFVDKAQYFIDSTFLFEQSVNQTVGDVQMYSGNQIVQLYDMPFSSTTYVQTANQTHTITGGTFAEAIVSGATFTYFTPPKKADIFVVNNAPAVSGILNTFSPIFSFKNVEDGKYYKVQVNYNTGDTSFTGDTTIFKFDSQIGNAEHIRTVAVALTPNSEFIYRIGNTKEIINLFEVKQNVTTWSEFVYARASNDGTFTTSGHTWLGGIGSTPWPNATITLTIQSIVSSVDLGSDTLSDPNTISEVTNPLGGTIGTSTSVTSDANGYFTFGKINGGQYTISVDSNDVNFPVQTISVFISADTNFDFIFSVLWGSTLIDFDQNFTFL